VHCEPRIKVIPPGQVKHAGPQITRLARMGGIELDEAQQMLAAATSGVGSDGKWRAFEAVVFAPRQNLKTEYLLARILAGLFLFGEDYIVYASDYPHWDGGWPHTVDTLLERTDLSDGLKRKILGDNALRFYRLAG